MHSCFLFTVNGANQTSALPYTADPTNSCYWHDPTNYLCNEYYIATGTITVPGGQQSTIAATVNTYWSTSWSFTVSASAAVAVTPDGGSVTQQPGTTTTQAFTVANQGNASATFTLAASCSGSAFATQSCSPSQSSVTIAANSSASINVGYTTVSGGTAGLETGQVTLTATHSSQTSVADVGSVTVNVTVPPPIVTGVTVAPGAATMPTQPGASRPPSTWRVRAVGWVSSRRRAPRRAR